MEGNLTIKIINDYPTTEIYTLTYTTNYFNYERTFCIDTIQEGQYCNNTEQRTIGKCHETFKACNESYTEDNNHCLACKDEGSIFFDLGNCISECENGNFTFNSIIILIF